MANDSQTQLRQRKPNTGNGSADTVGTAAVNTNAGTAAMTTVKQSGKQQSHGKSKRSTFDSYPDFVQCTVWQPKEADFDVIWRTLPIAERITIAERLKQEGADFFKAENWGEAARKFSQAAGLFHYVKKTAEVEGGLDDNYIELVTDDGEEEGGAQGRAMRSTCYTNIAQCLLKKAPNPSYSTAKRACESALELDPNNVKALYRRALACEGKVAAEGKLGTGLLEEALRDLVKAESVEPGNKLVREARVRIRATVKEQKLSEQRTFGDCLRDGGLGGSEERDKEAEQRREAEIAEEAEGEDLQLTLNNAQKLRNFYMDNNQMEKADDMEENIQGIQKRIEDRKTRRMNIYKPHENLEQAIKEKGIDLKDADQRQKFDRSMFAVNEDKREKEETERAVDEAFKASSNLSKEIREACIILLFIIALVFGSYLISGPKMDINLGNVDMDEIH